MAEAGDHAVGLLANGTENPFGVDEAVLVQQKALAERSAALTAKARRLQDLAEQYRLGQRRPAPDDPASAHNLSALLRAPITSHLFVLESRSGRPGTTQAAASRRTARGVTSGPVPTGTGPIEARSAFGLEPLDALTAGLGRARRLRLLQYSLVGVGGAALLTGIMMTVSSLNG